MKLIERRKADKPSWEDTVTVEMTRREFRVLVNSIAYIESAYPDLDAFEFGFSEEDAKLVRDAIDKIDEEISLPVST